MFSGLFTALVTPFKKGKIDEKAFQSFVDWQVKEGVHGVVPCGTTGESPTLTYEEHDRVIELCVEAVGGRAKVIAGTGSNSTDEAIRFTKHAKKAGADGALVVSPYYNKPTQEGLYRHYKAIAEAVNIPIIIYNIPGRSVINLTDETLARLSKLPNIVGVKDATGDLARVSTLRAAAGKKFCQLSGEDMTAVSFNAQGGVGCISVTSNVMPKRCAEIQNATLKGDFKRALELHDTLVPLHQAMFCETNPTPVKYAVSLLGRCAPELRLPLVMPGAESQKRVREAMKALKLI
jgi:4-hydroxy-tetrahydrodipicolinate synthase